ILAASKNLRLLVCDIALEGPGALELRSVAGGFLVQTRDRDTASASAAKVASKRAPTAAELADLDFAWRVCKHVKSNAIVFVSGGRTLGIGAGQMSRVDSVRIAVSKARAPLAERADLVVCGPEAPLAAGLGDAMRAAGLSFFGPSRAAAEIEGSKAFAKRLMRDAGVATAAFGVFEDVAAADAFIDAQPGA